MQNLSRRLFLKATFAGVAILTVRRLELPNKHPKGEVSLEVDKEGNAILHGVKTDIDERGNFQLRRNVIV